ncbi:MAG TPA: TldD/PmbA family protein, partial [Bacillota bacterium]|nr:TldD/PmbA family protein [Bacillota bacterium]
MQSKLREALAAAEADYCEIRMEETHATALSFRGKTLDKLCQSISYGGNVRALVSGGWGFVSFNSLDNLSEKVQAACRQAALIGSHKQEESAMAPVPVIVEEVPAEIKQDPRTVPLTDKITLFAGYNDLIMNYHESISSSFITYYDRHTDLYFANTEGSYIYQEKLDIGCNMRAIATRGDVTVQEGIGTGSNDDFGCVLDKEDDLRKACQLAVDLLDAPTVKGGEYTVMLDPEMAGLFVHEAFGHLSEADDIKDNPEMRRIMTL